MKTDFYDDEFIIKLTIEGTSYEEVEVKVTDPQKTIRDLISTIVSVFELSKMDGGGNLIQYVLGQTMEDGQDVILEYEDADGHELTLFDYNVHPGDHLNLIPVPLAGSPTVFLFEIEIKNTDITALELINTISSEWGLSCYYIKNKQNIETYLDINFYNNECLKRFSYWNCTTDTLEDYFYPKNGVYKTLSELGITPGIRIYIGANYHPYVPRKPNIIDKVKSVISNYKMSLKFKTKHKSISYKWINPNITRIINK